jgi:heme exporter protein A
MVDNTWHKDLKSSAMNLIANALGCERNGRVVFSNLSFTLQPGQCAELRGANGSGKSSLLRLIAGLVPQAAGRLSYGDSDNIPARLHLIAHQDAMKSAMTVAENLEFWAAVLDGHDIDAALAAFGLEALRNDPVQLLSAGQRRRLTLSRLFLARRTLWLLDEPMTAIDAASQDMLRQHVGDHLSTGGMVLTATHDNLGFKPDLTIMLGTA